jgi:5-methylcytosine-specific restriction enzyme subunit McrC
MRPPITVREFARLTTAQVENNLDQATLTTSAFEWLCQQRAKQRGADGLELLQISDRHSIRLDSYVGVIETPCGSRIEVLPKILEQASAENVVASRRVLRRMLARALDVAPRELSPTDIDVFDGPLTEWIAARFLSALDRLVMRGLRFEYHRVEEERRFLRGRLDVARQIRQPPGRRHVFRIQHDLFEPDCPENRLLRSALDKVLGFTQSPASWRLAHELASCLAPVPLSTNILQDFEHWRTDRLMAHYRAVKPWCSLILNKQAPLSMIGNTRAPSLLFPMEKLFERYVASCLQDCLLTGTKLVPTARRKYLCKHRDDDWFRLEPDLLLHNASKQWILDAKWKRLDAARANGNDKYGMSQHDLYQMFAYGHQYLQGSGDLVLIYPKTSALPAALDPFHFSATLRLWVVPFDLDEEVLVSHVADLPLRPRSAFRISTGTTRI